MKEIISASRKEDIITSIDRYNFLQNFLVDGNYEINNKYQCKSCKVDLQNIGAICLWSKNYKNFIDNPGLLDNYNLFFNFTITGFSKGIEPGVIDTDVAIKQMEYLANKYGPSVINWRFDPIGLLYNSNDPNPIDCEYLSIQRRFNKLCDAVSSYGVTRCTISFIEFYNCVINRLHDLSIKYYDFKDEEKILLCRRLVEIANNYGIQIYSCSSPILEGVNGIKKSSCIDGNLLGDLFNIKFSKAKDAGQRTHCGCTKSKDIGMYCKCPNKCVYCYGRV